MTEGKHVVFEKHYPLEFQHGNLPLSIPLTLREETLAFLGNTRQDNRNNVDIRSFLFLDTETIGLYGGAGTLPFLIGTGYFDDSGFQLTQHFVSDFSEEEAVLCSLNDLFKEFKGIVTFNGKAFDWPLIKDRYILHRMKLSLDEPEHIDLLHPSRRLWKEKINQCSLVNLEKRILEFNRVGDVPGHLIPGLYFQYLKFSDWSCISPVLKHNSLDILSMVSLLSKIGKALEGPLGSEDSLCCRELFALGKLFEERGNFRESEKCYRAAADSTEGMKKREALLRLARLYKRNKRWGHAVRIWILLVEQDIQLIEPCIELAKYYEHREKNFLLAYTYTEKAMQVLHHRFQMFRMKPDRQLVEKIQHRKQRLQKKIAIYQKRYKQAPFRNDCGIP